MKSLEFGAWQPVKSLDYKFSFAFCHVFLSFDKAYDVFDKPVFINPASLSTTSCQYVITYNPEFLNPVWFRL